MNRARQFRLLTIGLLLALLWLPGEASAAQCGSTAAGFEAWKRQFAGEAQARGVSASTIAALVATNYSTATIAADRGQRSFSLSLDQFLAAVRPSSRGGERSSNQMQRFSRQSSNVSASRRDRSWQFGEWRRVSEARAEIRTSCRRWLLSPTTAVGRPISPTSSDTDGARYPFSRHARLHAW
jgi:hypothetical protein